MEKPPTTPRPRPTRKLLLGAALCVLGLVMIAEALIAPETKQKLGEKLAPKPATDDDPTQVQE